MFIGFRELLILVVIAAIAWFVLRRGRSPAATPRARPPGQPRSQGEAAGGGQPMATLRACPTCGVWRVPDPSGICGKPGCPLSLSSASGTSGR